MIVVGAGQAGLSLSWYLRLFGIDHLVLERGRAGESWRSARWDSFHLVTPAWMTRLPGLSQPAGAAQGFTPRADVVTLLEDYGAGAPLQEGVEVRSVRHHSESFELATTAGTFASRVVVAASGAQRRPVVHRLADRLNGDVLQLHASQYRNPATLPAGAVLVVGSGQSGAQFAEELARAGRQVFLATSRVGRLPRRYRGRDAHDWAAELGLHDRRTDQASEPERRVPHPLLTGAAGGHTLALPQLARDGVVLLGRLLDIDGSQLRLSDDLSGNLRFGDESSAAFKQAVDEHIHRHGVAAPPPEPDPAERPYLPALRPAKLDLINEGISTVIWSTGFGPDTAWVSLPILDDSRNILNSGGVTSAPGFFTLGAPWLTHRGSGILYGVGADASRIARHVSAFLRSGSANQVRDDEPAQAVAR